MNEPERLEDLYRYAILDTPPEECFDQLTSLAAQVCAVPIALISFVDYDRQWFKSRVGLEDTQTSRDHAFCAHAILGSDGMVVEDAALDARFAGSALVCGDPGIRFYAGAPLKTPSGTVLGSLCVIDRRPRVISDQQFNMLKVLACQVEQQLALRRVAGILRRQATLSDKTQRIAHIGGWELDLRTQTLSWTDETYRIHGLVPGAFVPTLDSAIDWYAPGSKAVIRAAVEATIACGTPFDLDLQIVARNGSTRWVRATGQRGDKGGNANRIFGIFQDTTEQRQLETEILRIAQREQARIDATLRDGLGEELRGVSFLLRAVAAQMPQGDSRLLANFTQLTRLVRDAIGTCRSLAHGLSPTGRERGGLIAALQSLASRIQQIHNVNIIVRVRGQDWAFDSVVAEHLYRIAQEAIANAIKHADPRQIVVSFYATALNTLLSITDDGVGVIGNAYVEGMGLQIIRYRARLIGATATIEGTVSGGTRVRCRISTATAAAPADLQNPQ